MKHILIVEDDQKIAELVQLYCNQEGWRALHASTGSEGLELAQSTHPDVLVLDIMLPEQNGLDVLKELRKHSNVPVIMLTAKSEESDKIIGLELGADDYLTKPFSPKELIARIKAVLRRSAPASSEDTELHYRDLHLNKEKMEARQNKKVLELTAIEFKLLWTLLSHPGRVFSREQVMEAVYESSSHIVFDRTIDGHIKKLRKKLKDDPKKPKYIASVFGVGYKAKAL